MITFRTVADVTPDRQVAFHLPPETPLGPAELLVVVAPCAPQGERGGGLRSQFGTVRSGDPQSADNARIDAALSEAYDTFRE